MLPFVQDPTPDTESVANLVGSADPASLTHGFLFADLRGYSAYVEAHGDRAASALLDAYRRLMRETIAEHGGAEIKTEGDSFYVVVPSASGAVLCGLSIAAAAAAQAAADPEHPIRVGVGVNAGESVTGAEGYVGSAVNIAARVCAVAKAGEVVVTDTVRSLTRSGGKLQFTPLGKRHLKGIAEPIALYRAEPAGATSLAAGGPPWRRPRLLAGAGALMLVAVLGAAAVTGGFGLGGPRSSASPSVPLAQNVERIAYAEAGPLGTTVGDPRICSPGKFLYGSVGDVRLALVDPNGGDPVYLTSVEDELAVHPAWSPDGTELAFVGWASSGGRSNVYVLKVASGKTTKVAGFSEDGDASYLGRIDGVSWSSDGTRLLFGWGRKIWQVNRDGSGLQSLPVTMPVDLGSGPLFTGVVPDPIPIAPVWLSNGSIAAILDDQVGDRTGDPSSGKRKLATVPAGRGVLTPVPWIPDKMRVESAAWSPDGTRLAFTAADMSNGGNPLFPDLFVATADGGDVHSLDAARRKAADPAWSADGRELVFGFSALQVANANTGEIREVLPAGEKAACWPTWTKTTVAALPKTTPTPAPGASETPLPFHLGALDPGPYLTAEFQPAMQFTLGPGWDGVTLATDTVRMSPSDMPQTELDILNVQVVIDAPCLDPPTHVIGGDPLSLITFLQKNQYLSTGDAVPYTVAGLTGLAVEVSQKRQLTPSDCPGQPSDPLTQYVHLIKTSGGDWYRIGEGNKVWFIAVPVRGLLLAFSIEAPADQLDQFRARAEVILDSVIFP